MANPAVITAANQFTDPIRTQGGGFDLSVYGAATWSGTLTLQRSRDGTNWRDITTYTAEAEEVGEVDGTWYIRCGAKSGATISGSITVEVSA